MMNEKLHDLLHPVSVRLSFARFINWPFEIKLCETVNVKDRFCGTETGNESTTRKCHSDDICLFQAELTRLINQPTYWQTG